MLQQAFLRGASLPQVSEIITVTNRELIFKTEDEYREISHLAQNPIDHSFILEPFGRNTAPAIAAASLQAAKKYGDKAILLVLAADHLISDQQSFIRSVAEACVLAQKGKIVTFGIQPTAPDTEYGYIESNGNNVIRFVEKPNIDQAQEYVSSGTYLWNSGMFCFPVGLMLQEMAEHCPEILNTTRICLQKSRTISADQFTQTNLASEYFEPVPDQSIDYAVMEKTRNAAVVACDVGWSDIGCWKALGNLTTSDSNNNRIRGEVLLQKTKGCSIISESRNGGVVGLENLIIVDTPDALLVADKNRAPKVKQIFSQLKMRDHDTHKLYRTVHRPWGTYIVLEEGPNFKIKRIEVKPGASLSLQMHYRRSEHWVVVSGTAQVLNHDRELTLNINESTFIPAEHKHRLENASSELLVMIEVQTGDYLGEDDIVRFQDIYNRESCVA